MPSFPPTFPPFGTSNCLQRCCAGTLVHGAGAGHHITKANTWSFSDHTALLHPEIGQLELRLTAWTPKLDSVRCCLWSDAYRAVLPTPRKISCKGIDMASGTREYVDLPDCAEELQILMADQPDFDLTALLDNLKRPSWGRSLTSVVLRQVGEEVEDGLIGFFEPGTEPAIICAARNIVLRIVVPRPIHTPSFRDLVAAAKALSNQHGPRQALARM